MTIIIVIDYVGLSSSIRFGPGNTLERSTSRTTPSLHNSLSNSSINDIHFIQYSISLDLLRRAAHQAAHRHYLSNPCTTFRDYSEHINLLLSIYATSVLTGTPVSMIASTILQSLPAWMSIIDVEVSRLSTLHSISVKVCEHGLYLVIDSDTDVDCNGSCLVRQDIARCTIADLMPITGSLAYTLVSLDSIGSRLLGLHADAQDRSTYECQAMSFGHELEKSLVPVYQCVCQEANQRWQIVCRLDPTLCW